VSASERAVPTISAIVITKNEEAVIRRCLESVAWAQQIVVVDCGSTDATVEICRELGATVHMTDDWPGFGPQKNRALDRATGDWVLSLDADEWVTPALRAELERVIGLPQPRPGYAIPRRSSFCGRFMRHSGWWPDYVLRLFKREAGRFSNDRTHERLIVQGQLGRLREPLLHEAVRDIEQMLAKMDGYSSSSAHERFERGRRASLATAIAHGVWTFFRTYVLRLGFLDGREGFILAVANAEGSYYRYVKLMMLARRR
jgi:glycosyltransferase involved in cell wall biosynthesis